MAPNGRAMARVRLSRRGVRLVRNLRRMRVGGRRCSACESNVGRRCEHTIPGGIGNARQPCVPALYEAVVAVAHGANPPLPAHSSQPVTPVSLRPRSHEPHTEADIPAPLPI